MNHANERREIEALFRYWVADRSGTLPYIGQDGGLIFFGWIQKNRPDVLDIRCSGDRWQHVSAWLRNSDLVR